MSDNPIITPEEAAALLGRPLTAVEVANYNLYLEISVLRLDDLLCIKLEDMAELPADLKLLIARCFASIGKEQQAEASHGITSKQVEDYHISYDVDADDPMTEFVQLNAKTIDAYGMCQGPMRIGGACIPCGDCYDCL